MWPMGKSTPEGFIEFLEVMKQHHSATSLDSNLLSVKVHCSSPITPLSAPDAKRAHPALSPAYQHLGLASEVRVGIAVQSHGFFKKR